MQNNHGNAFPNRYSNDRMMHTQNISNNFHFYCNCFHNETGTLTVIATVQPNMNKIVTILDPVGVLGNIKKWNERKWWNCIYFIVFTRGSVAIY